MIQWGQGSALPHNAPSHPPLQDQAPPHVGIHPWLRSPYMGTSQSLGILLPARAFWSCSQV